MYIRPASRSVRLAWFLLFYDPGEKHMYSEPRSEVDGILMSLLVRGGLSFLIVLVWMTATANGQNQTGASVGGAPTHVTHILGFEEVRRDVSGELSIDGGDLRFRREGGPATHVSIPSIQNISLGEQDKQVGGKPMMLGKAAVPFGGGRVVSLFSHKKYDSLTIEYVDSRGGLHSAIFRMGKGQAEGFKKDLIAHGAHADQSEDPIPLQSTIEESLEVQKWSVQVDRVDAGDTSVDTCVSNAIYENLLRQLLKSKQFEHVYRSGDRTANDVSGVLVLKTRVTKYFPGSETRRAVTTISGATKLKVHIQLVTRARRVVLECDVQGDIRFLGENLKATDKVASKTAKLLKRSTLALPAASRPQPTVAKEAI